MLSPKFLVLLCLVGSAATVSASNSTLNGCGQVNVILTGLPANHPNVTSQGWEPKFVEDSRKTDTANIVNAGYNPISVLFGPEVDVRAALAPKMEGINWTVAITGFGVRGSNSTQLTIQLENILALYREKAANADLAFNHSPTSGLEAIQRHAPLSSNCTDSPGIDYGTYILCDPSVCSEPL